MLPTFLVLPPKPPLLVKLSANLLIPRPTGTPTLVLLLAQLIKSTGQKMMEIIPTNLVSLFPTVILLEKLWPSLISLGTILISTSPPLAKSISITTFPPKFLLLLVMSMPKMKSNLLLIP